MTNEAKLESLVLDAHSIALPIGLVVDKFSMDIGQASAVIKPFNLSFQEPAKYEATVGQDSVADFLNKKGLGGLRDFGVKVANGKVVIEALARVIVELRVAVTCTLRVEDESKLFVDLESVSVPGPMARGLVEKELAKANPIFDLAEIAPTVKIVSVIADDGVILVRGTADWPQSP